MKTQWNFSEQGTIESHGGKIWFGISGNQDSPETPLIVIHGGPGIRTWGVASFLVRPA